MPVSHEQRIVLLFVKIAVLLLQMNK